jgi:hypothetical protein
MGTFDSIYLNKIKQLQEENKRLKSLLEADGPESQFEWEYGEASPPRRTRKEEEEEAKRLAQQHEAGRKRLLELGFDVHDPKYNLSPSLIKMLTGPR